MVCRIPIFSSLLDFFPNCMFFLSFHLVGSLKMVQMHFCNLVLVFFHSLVKLKLQLNEEGKIPVRK